MTASASVTPTAGAGRRLDRSAVARYVAVLAGVLALICFYLPWVQGTVPNAGASVFSGADIARSEAARRADDASPPATGAGAGAGAATSGGLTLPTRIPTIVPGAGASQAGGAAAPAAGGAAAGAGAAAGGLTLPTRIPTVAAAPGSGAGAAAGGLTLPTRIPTVAAGGAAQGEAGAQAGQGASGPGVAIATSAAATRTAFEEQRAAGGAQAVAITEDARPDALPGLILFGVPLAAAGVAIFAAVWSRLETARDRRYGKAWTLIFACGGLLGAGWVLVKVTTAPQPNDLLAPGDAGGALWGLWATVIAFAVAAASLVVAWTARESQVQEAGPPPLEEEAPLPEPLLAVPAAPE
jgi:hypothetical protein